MLVLEYVTRGSKVNTLIEHGIVVVPDKVTIMETLLEQQRRYHEERERLMDGMVQERLQKKNAHRETVNSEHRQRVMLDR